MFRDQIEDESCAIRSQEKHIEPTWIAFKASAKYSRLTAADGSNVAATFTLRAA